MHLVERLPHDMIFVPVHWWTSYDVLWFGNSRKLRFLRGRSFYACGIFSRRPILVFATLTLFLPCRLGYVGKSRREYVALCFGSVCPLLLQRANEALRVGHSGSLEFLQGLEIALALLALQL